MRDIAAHETAQFDNGIQHAAAESAALEELFALQSPNQRVEFRRLSRTAFIYP